MKNLNQNVHSGASATELAILLPLVAFLCLSAVDFGRYARWAIALENSVRVGVEYGAARRVTAYTYDEWAAEIESRVREEFGEVNQDDLSVDVDISSLNDELPRVEVAGEYTFTTVIPWWAISESMVIRRRSTMQRYR